MIVLYAWPHEGKYIKHYSKLCFNGNLTRLHIYIKDENRAILFGSCGAYEWESKPRKLDEFIVPEFWSNEYGNCISVNGI